MNWATLLSILLEIIAAIQKYYVKSPKGIGEPTEAEILAEAEKHLTHKGVEVSPEEVKYAWDQLMIVKDNRLSKYPSE